MLPTLKYTSNINHFKDIYQQLAVFGGKVRGREVTLNLKFKLK
jgi:hypothetical protein